MVIATKRICNSTKSSKPKTIKQIQAYLGLIQYIARYVHNHRSSRYLTILTRKDSKQKWGEQQDMAFNMIQERVKNVKLLYHPTLDDPFLVQCDASKYAIAGVLFQKQYDRSTNTRQWKIIEFYSKQIDPHLIKHPIMRSVWHCVFIKPFETFLIEKKIF